MIKTHSGLLASNIRIKGQTKQTTQNQETRWSSSASSVARSVKSLPTPTFARIALRAGLRRKAIGKKTRRFSWWILKTGFWGMKLFFFLGGDETSNLCYVFWNRSHTTKQHTLRKSMVLPRKQLCFSCLFPRVV